MKHLTDEQIQQLIDDPGVNHSALSHIEECPECMEIYMAFQGVHDSLSQIEYAKPSLRFAKNIYDLIIRKQQLEQKELRWIKIIQGAIFSSIFLIILISLYFLLLNGGKISIPELDLSLYFQWSIIMLISVVSIWILYGIDQFYSKQNKEQRS